MGRMSRDKGKVWERVVAARLRAIFGDGVKRGWQARQGSDAPDVEGVPFWVECKHHRVVNIGQAVRQALAAAEKAKLPVLIASKSNRQEPLATMLLEDWLGLVEELANLRAAVDKQVPRVQKAVELWRAAHPGNEKTWPDLGDLVDWLIAQRGAAREALAQVKVDHINRAIQLPLSTHGMVENALLVSEAAKLRADHEAAKARMRELDHAAYGVEPKTPEASIGWTCPGHANRLDPCPGGTFPPSADHENALLVGPFLCVSAQNARCDPARGTHVMPHRGCVLR